MRKILGLVMAILLMVCLTFSTAAAEAALPVTPEGNAIEIAAEAPGINVGEPLTWGYLATIAGAAALTLLIVQFLKVPLDRVWKIPTRAFAYVIALCIMLIATAFTTGLTADSALLVAANAFIAATSAYGAYELTFAKSGK